MRIFTLGLGGLLLLSGVVLVVLADQEREVALEQATRNVVVLEQSLERARAMNLTHAETLTTLRSAIADEQAQLADTEGFLE
ncbi:hypothetical protein [Microbacterium sp. A93]|uniref:hypothetical protein n=1 Tax=unclassified Microbacterium TaxID=2609290 RepID=UPI003F43BC91